MDLNTNSKNPRGRYHLRNTGIAITLFALCSALAFVVAASMTGTSAAASAHKAMPQSTPEKPLDEAAVAALLEQLKSGLSNLIADEDAVAAITEKWDARTDLTGKTRTQILSLLFADVKSVVDDKETQDKIWSSWKIAPKDENTPPKPAEPQPKEPDTPYRLIVTNLSYQTTEDQIQDLFSQVGTVVSVNLVTDKDTGRSKRVAFVVMASRAESEAAIATFNGVSIDGSILMVNVARDRPKDK